MKFIQITATGVQNNSGTQANCYVFGLTESGDVYWSCDADRFDAWTRVIKGTEE